MNYLSYVIQSKIIKKSDVVINIPTFNGYEVTKKTIRTLFDQININFDILLIDNASDDYEDLSLDFPSLNYVVLKENTGGSGAQRIGAELALKYNYKYIVFTDNDALLLSKDGLSRMKNKCSEEGVVGVVPQNIDLLPKQNIKKSFSKLKGFFPLHYFLIKAGILKKTGLHNFFMFLSGDDASLSSKLLSCGNVIIDHKTLFYHPLFKPKNIQNKNTFFTIRSLLIMIVTENNIKLRWKLRALLFIIFILMQSMIHSIEFRDLSYIKTMFYICQSFIYGYKNMDKFEDILKKVPENKFILKEVNEIEIDQMDNLKDLSKLQNLLFLPKFGFVHSNFLNKNIYYKLTRNV